MNHCPLCDRTRCGCAANEPIRFVRGVIAGELEHLERTEAALRHPPGVGISSADAASRAELAERYRVRYLAVADLAETLDRAVADHTQKVEVPKEASLRQTAAAGRLIPLPDRPSERPRSQEETAQTR